MHLFSGRLLTTGVGLAAYEQRKTGHVELGTYYGNWLWPLVFDVLLLNDGG